MKNLLIFIVAAAIGGSSLAGCVTKTRVIRDETLQFRFDKDPPPTQERDGLTVSVRVYSPKDANDDPVITRTVPIAITRAGVTAQQTSQIRLLPSPFFKVTIKNHTQFALRMDRAIIRLKDEADNELKVLTKAEVEDRLTSDLLNAQTFYANEQNMQVAFPNMGADCRRIKLLSTETVIAPEDTFSGYIAFDVPDDRRDLKKLSAWAQQAGALRLQMYQVPVATDAAGTVTKATKFEFAVRGRVDVTERTEQYQTIGFGDDPAKP